jgi:hypothetical protein
MPPFNPLEILNQQRHHKNVEYQHEGSPLLRSEEARLSEEEINRILFKTKQRKHFRSADFIKSAVLSVCTLAAIALVWITLAITSTPKALPPAELHRDHVLPTLLSVVNPDTNSFVYALNNTLYEKMLHSVDYVSDLKHSSSYVRCKGACEFPQLWLDKTSISATTDDDATDTSLTLSWSMGREGKMRNILLQDDDVIALYCPDDGDDVGTNSVDPKSFLEAATIAQAKATSAKNGGKDGDNSWYLPRFPILRRESCHFRLYMVVPASRHQPERFVHVASTDPLAIVNAKETPTAIHLAYTSSFSAMTVSFTTGNLTTSTTDAVPVVRYSKVSSKPKPFHIATGTSDSYLASDLCQEPGNITEAGKFYPPGMLHTVEMHELEPLTQYEYEVGVSTNGTVTVWSEPSIFTTAPKGGDDKQEFSYIVYGDQGCPDSGCHDGKRWLKSMVKRETNVTAVHHFGDISYANGAAHVWDAWFRMVAAFSRTLPLMIAIGNHEYDHTAGGVGKDPSGVKTADGFQPSWGNFNANDSGGECGVPMAKRFRMPSSPKSNGVFWYSYSYGLVHTIVISSEHDLSMGSPQYNFLEHDLVSVDRKVTPWVILESHRPLYEGQVGEHWISNTLVGEAMRDEFEDLLYVHRVDVVLAGHYHEYHRTCLGLYRGVCSKDGPVHITVGAAGAPLDNFYAAATTYSNPWTARYLPGVFGYGKLEGNATDLHFSFVQHGDEHDSLAGQVLDTLWIPRKVW